VSIELFDISTTGEDQYRLSFRVSGRVVTYVVSVADAPVSGVSGPHSLWSFLQVSKGASQQVMNAVFQFRRTGDVSLPQLLPIQLDETAAGLLSEAPLWSSRSASWYASRESLDWAAKHLLRTASNSLFPIPFEHQVIAHRIDDFRAKAQAVDLYAHRLSHYRTMQAPKASSEDRIATQLDPLDSLLFSAIAFEIGERVEAARVPLSESIVHSFRFRPDEAGGLWNQDASYNSFQERTREVLTSESAAVVAETDISAFYHRIAPHHVGVSLEQIGVNGKIAQAVTNILRSYSSNGLPVGPSASALFADAILSPIDWDLKSQGFRFLRFNDDYRFFCRGEREAKNALRVLANSLWRTSGLTLHDPKTQVVNRDEYLENLKPDGWLEQLRDSVREAMYEVDDEVTAVNAKLVASARALFQESISDDHPTWVRLCKAAFSALPLEEKRAVLPLVLDKLGKVWSVAPQVGRSIEDMLASGIAAGDVVDLVVTHLTKAAAPLPDYAATWLLHGFHGEGWPKRESLSRIDDKLGLSLTAARRELLIALKGTQAAKGVRFDAHNPWQNRAHVWATGNWDGSVPAATDESRQEWVLALYDALTSADSNG
jgi:hypothetical protein